jgi:hypothetical protein
VVSVEGNPDNGVSLGIAIINCLDVCPTALRRLRSVIYYIPVVIKEVVAYLAAPRDGKNGVMDSVLSIVGHWVCTGAGTSAADLRVPRQYGDGTEILAEGVGKDIGYGGPVAEASRETEALVDAEIVLYRLYGRLDEVDI